MPTDITAVEVALLPKPKGGHRPIGVYPALERLASKARKAEVDEWMESVARDYFACSKGSGAMDVVWAQAVRAEANVAGGKHCASILWERCVRLLCASCWHRILLACERIQCAF